MTPDDLLKYHRRLRDIGSIILLIGVFAEIMIDEFWEISHPPLLRGPKATGLIKSRAAVWKRPALLFVGICLVGGGIALDWRQGTDADDVADQIRDRQQREIVSLAIQSNALLRMASGRAAQLLNTPKLAALQQFHDIKVFFEISDSLDHEAVAFTQRLGRILALLHWHVDNWDRRTTLTPPPEDNVRVCIRIYGPVPSPKETHAVAAANSLDEYLRSVGIDSFFGECIGVKSGDVLIVIGKRSATMDPSLLANLENALSSLNRQNP